MGRAPSPVEIGKSINQSMSRKEEALIEMSEPLIWGFPVEIGKSMGKSKCCLDCICIVGIDQSTVL